VLPGKALLLLDHAGARGRGKGSDASREVREASARLTEEIDRLNQDKETAVAQQSFDRAAELRDRADRLKKQREALLDQEKHLRQVNGGTVEAADVADTLAQLTGSQPPPDGLSFVTGIKRPRD
jgi:ATP-dependent Clp protease ATP-binding subunit ClpC